MANQTPTPHLNQIAETFDNCLEKLHAQTIIKDLNVTISNLVDMNWLKKTLINIIYFYRYHCPQNLLQGQLPLHKNSIRVALTKTYQVLEELQHIKNMINRIATFVEFNLGPLPRINTQSLELLEQKAQALGTGTFILTDYIYSAIILKWLQGQIINQLSPQTKDYITMIGALFGEINRGSPYLVKPVEFTPPVADQKIIMNNFDDFFSSVQMVRDITIQAKTEFNPTDNLGELIIVNEKLKELIRISKDGGDLQSRECFAYKLLIASFLIYLQSDFFAQKEHCQDIINEFVELYRGFRDNY